MPKTNVYDMTGKRVGEITLSESVFGIEPNQSVVHDVVKKARFWLIPDSWKTKK